jgi:A/G-specific adenine glycosylase
MMDLGATICTPRAPACAICPLSDLCAGRAAGLAAELPRKAPKAAKPLREGTLWLARAPGAWLMERRAPRGLLGGTLGLPGDGWDGAGGPAPLDCPWHPAGEVRHTFTHFHLTARVLVADLPAPLPALRGTWLAAEAVRPDDLPTVMAKAFALGAATFSPR